MRVHVELPQELDVNVYRERNARGEVPDRTPYGLHHIASEGVDVTFREPMRGHQAALARRVRNRLDGYEAVAAVVSAAQRRGADVVLCMDERTGTPAALTSRRPVVSGVAWLEDPRTLSPAHRRTTGLALRRTAAVFTQSPGLLPTLRNLWGLDPDRVHGITLGIDPEFYTERPWHDRDTDGMTVTSVGDDRGRDHKTLIAAIQRIRSNGLPAWLELATTLPVTLPADAGVLHARRMNAAMRGLYARSSVVALALHPNANGSGLTVTLEAMASGRPVVVTNNPGLDAYVEHGRTGLLVPPSDPEALAAAISELLTDPARAAHMGHAGRKDVETRFTSAHMAAELSALATSVS